MWTLWLAPTIIVGHAAGRIVGLLGARHLRGRPRPGFVRGPAAFAWLYEIPPGLGLDWVGAVTLGHVILHRPRFFEGTAGQLILAHELAHTRQHDVLGPLYLPLHILAQSVSALLSLGRAPTHTRVHDHNPLEQTFICLGASAYAPLARRPTRAGRPITAEGMLAAFGLPQPASRSGAPE